MKERKPVDRARSALALLFGPPVRRPFAVRYWDGTCDGAGAAPGPAPVFTLVLRRPGALRRMFLPPSALRLGEAYLRDDYDVEGDIEAAAALADAIRERLRSPVMLARLVPRLLALPGDDGSDASTSSSPGQGGGTAIARADRTAGRRGQREDAEAIHFHYDVSNDFYALWLDRRMVYSCGYFESPDACLDDAQEAKLEYICRKLRLRRGERLLDIGCGWGGLMLYAAQKYGVDATGITLSDKQLQFVRERIDAAGMQGRCRVQLSHYAALPKDTVFDKVVSVGMFEHVGAGQLPGYFATAARLTRPGGLFLNHGISASGPPGFGGPLGAAAGALWRDGAFMQRYVFPGGHLVRPAEVVRLGEDAGFEVRDLENLREHYVLTLRHWVRRLEERHAEAVRMVGEASYRVWRVYMAACAQRFSAGKLGLIQTLFSRTDGQGHAGLPLTRADLYAAPMQKE